MNDDPVQTTAARIAAVTERIVTLLLPRAEIITTRYAKHMVTDFLTALTEEPTLMGKVFIVIENGQVTPICASEEIEVIILDLDGSPDADQSDRITIIAPRVFTDAVVERLVLAKGSDLPVIIDEE